MAIDSSIYGQIQPIQIESPINALAKVTQLKNAQNQNRLFDMQVADSERARAGENALNDAYRKAYRPDGSLDEQGLVSNLAQSGQGGKIAGIQEGFAKTAKAKAEATKFQLDNSLKTLDVVSQSLSPTLQNPALYPQVKAALMQKYPEGAANLPDQFDPAAIQAVINKTLTAKDQINIKQKELDQVLAREKFTYDQKNDAANRGVTIRGQNMTDARGRDLAAATRDAGGKPPAGYRYTAEGNLQPIPGGPADLKAGQAGELRAIAAEKAQSAIDLIDKAINHPGRETATGKSGVLDPRNYSPGTDATNFQVVLDQLGGQAFLQAFESLKGGGQITEIEGKKATDAMARLNRKQSDAEFKRSLEDLKEVYKAGLKRAGVQPKESNIDSLLDKYK